MFAKVKPQVFLDSIILELFSPQNNCVKAVLKDERGSVCRSVETETLEQAPSFTWNGLNDLPYGVYTLELSQGHEEMKVQLVKRV
jgi:hypothetical protein